jgi:hypothetical protein
MTVSDIVILLFLKNFDTGIEGIVKNCYEKLPNLGIKEADGPNFLIVSNQNDHDKNQEEDNEF